MIQTTIYKTTGLTYYCRFVLQRDNRIWDNVAGELAAAPSWADSVVVMTEVSGTGQYPIEVPDDLPGGIYDIVVYLQDGASPVNTDTVDSGYVLKKGSIFGF